jgi:hypothetical protein
MMAALGLALVEPFHRLSLRAFSRGDSTFFDLLFSEPPLLLLAKEMPLDLGRGREAGEVGCSILDILLEGLAKKA